MTDKKSKFQPPAAAQSTPRRSMKEAFSDGEEPTTMFTLRMNSDLHRRLKIRAVTEGRSMKEILEGLLQSYLDVNE
ncbi:ribbon-helix-helix protein [Corynebacterium halotolerans]|uniref:ribbon-helix-helix protein n=1 Tax=Corynebacterium halotolerans TaxID=225326 RepID=UPI003CEC7FD2